MLKMKFIKKSDCLNTKEMEVRAKIKVRAVQTMSRDKRRPDSKDF